jgi:hypothetical protein
MQTGMDKMSRMKEKEIGLSESCLSCPSLLTPLLFKLTHYSSNGLLDTLFPVGENGRLRAQAGFSA